MAERNALLSGVSSLVLTFLSVAGALVSAAAMLGRAPPTAPTILVIGTLATWPFVFFAHYAALRWVGVSATPFLDSLVTRAGIAANAIRVPAGGILSIPNALLGILVGAFLLPEMSSPENAPLSGLSATDTLLANLTILQEELIFRNILFWPLIALLGVRAADRTRLPDVRVWIVIVLTGVSFGYAHIGVADMIGADRDQYLLFAIVQKGLVAGTIFGYVAWRWGVEASIYSHYTMNLILVALSLALS